MNKKHWSQQYIGKAWLDVGGCWEFYRTIVKERLCVDLPEYAGTSRTKLKEYAAKIMEGENSEEWTESSVPKEGDCVGMSSIKGIWNHVGYYMTGGFVLHVSHNTQSIISKLPELRKLGYKRYKIMNHVHFS